MTSFNSTSYEYRSDGMRVYKSNSTGSTSYRYDGQMGIEDIDFAANGSISKVTDYGIGARGIDAMYVTQNGTTTPAYPIYDAHGNMLSTLTRQGTSSFATSSIRTYDAWGNIRIGAQTGDPKGRYCANLGHKQDDESGLIYMRARYYEPGSGRFISEDPKGHGTNWFTYCSGDPVNRIDITGQEDLAETLAADGLGASLEDIGVGTLEGTIQFVDDEIMVDVKMFSGQPGVTTAAMALVRQWAAGQGLNAIFIQGTVASAGGRGAVMAALMAIKAFGDSGSVLSTQDNPITAIYWILDGTD